MGWAVRPTWGGTKKDKLLVLPHAGGVFSEKKENQMQMVHIETLTVIVPRAYVFHKHMVIFKKSQSRTLLALGRNDRGINNVYIHPP